MPIYDYRCTSCGFEKEYLQKISDPLMTVCPQCQKDTFVKKLTAAGFQLKGSGWYATDFRNSGAPKPAGDAKTDASTGDKSGDQSGDQSGEKSETKTDTKTDAKTDTKSDTKTNTKTDAGGGSKPDSSASAASPSGSGGIATGS